MRKKKKFKPVITRVRLNPEQAVLSCDCYQYGWKDTNTKEAAYYDRCNIISFFGSKGIQFSSQYWAPGSSSS